MRPRLPHPYYLTPSKASMLASGDFSFLQSYFIGHKKEQTDSMKKGILVHEIFYDLIKADNDIEKSALVYMLESEKQSTKKKTQSRMNRSQLDELEQVVEKSKIIYKELKPVTQAIQMALELNEIFKQYRKDKIEFEVVLESTQFELTGIVDIKSSHRISDIKTTSKEFSTASEFIKWNEKGFAVQQIHYESLCKLNGIIPSEPFLFHVIQLCWPYQIINVQLDPRFVCEVKKWYNLDIYPAWKTLWRKLEDTFGKYPFQKPKGLRDKIAMWEKAQNHKIYDWSQIQIAKPSNFFMSDIKKDIDKLQKRALGEFLK